MTAELSGQSGESGESPVGGDTAPAPDEQARRVFGERLALARRYADRLADEGVRHGHLGPREIPRLWERHLVNCALLTDLVPAGTRVVDVGSGAGLPGLPMALRRPDLHVDLVEPMWRRIRFLAATVSELGLDANVRITRGRAEDPAVIARVGNADFVVTRAVAPLDRLVRWCLPLLAPGGSLLALKGESAQDELDTHRRALQQSGADQAEVIRLGADAAATWVVRIHRATGASREQQGQRKQRGQRRGKGTR